MSSFELIFDVEGMMCQKNCGSTVQSAIAELPFVKEAVADFAKKAAYVNLKNHDNVEGYIKEIIDAIESVGYEASLKKSAIEVRSDVELGPVLDQSSDLLNDSVDVLNSNPDITIIVDNMITANDIKRIDDILSKTDGVFNLKINSSSKTIQIWGFADETEILKLLILKGFQAMAMDQYKKQQREAKLAKVPDISSQNLSLKRTFVLNLKSLKDYKKADWLRESLEQLNRGPSGSSKKNANLPAPPANETVVDVQYDGLSKEFKITFNSQFISEDQIRSTLEDHEMSHYLLSATANTQSNQREFHYNIRGMSCGACAVKIEREMKKMPGVVTASVSVMTQQGKAVIDESLPNAVGPRDIMKKIDSLGYEMSLMTSGSNSSSFSSATIESYQKELNEWKQLLVVSIIFGIPIIFFHLGAHFIEPLMMILEKPAGVCHNGIQIGQMLMLILNIPMLIIVGSKYYKSAFLGLLHGIYGMDLLVMTGTSITFTYSVIQLCLSCISDESTDHVFFETTGMLLFFVTIGKYIESYAKGRSASSIAELLKLQPRDAYLVSGETATQLLNYNSYYFHQSDVVPNGSSVSNSAKITIRDEDIQCIDVDLLQKGDVVRILPGDRIPTDGKVLFGHSYVDESMITGESIPIHKKFNDLLFGSTVNQGGTIYMVVTTYGSESALSQIVRLVEVAQMNKAPVQDYADKLAGIFTPVILILAAVTFFTWLTLSEMEIVPSSWFKDEYNDPVLFSLLFSISVVVISCPCALGLATPTAIMVGTTVGAKHGILIKGGSAFEMAHKIDTIVFDKTGTLTVGKPTVTDIIPLVECEESFPEDSAVNRILLLAVTAEQESDHPLAKAIQKQAELKNIKPLPLTEENASTQSIGSGISCLSSAGKICIGNRKFMKQCEIPLTTTAEMSMWNLEIQGKTAICIACNQKIYGIIGIADVPKEEAALALKVLKSLGMDIWMFTGDNNTTAEALANKLEISTDRIIANMLPEDKVNKMKELQSQGHLVAMVGDGINDSPALVQSHLGIAIGAGTQIAIESAQMVLIRSSLRDLVVAFDLAKIVFRRIKINFLWAVIYNFISIPFAAGVWFPWTKMLLPPHYAGLAMALSSISVVISSMLLRRYRVPSELFDEQERHAMMEDDEMYGDSSRHPLHRTSSDEDDRVKASASACNCCAKCFSGASCTESNGCGCDQCCCFTRSEPRQVYRKLPKNEKEAMEFFGIELGLGRANPLHKNQPQITKFAEELEEFTV